VISFWLVMMAVFILILAWHVRGLDDRCRDLDDSIRTEALHRTSADNQRTLWSYHAELHTRVTALAHALGYEWKRTEAKEGWERKSVFADGPWQRKLMGEYLWNNGDDRRKADRRKPNDSLAPNLTPVCGECFKRAASTPKSPPKKPRRAH